MKSRQIALIAIFTGALSTAAHANHDDSVETPSAPTNVSVGQSTQPGKTRAQVHQELIDARREGIIPTTEADYPPSQRSIDANRARNRIFERYWSGKN